ncbi:MAG TPA: dihydroorotase [Bacteroidia bacterium]|nr:dihydroorotase [Bacteroidia bacterium]
MILIKNATLVNEGAIRVTDVLIKNGRIEKIGAGISVDSAARVTELDATGLHLFPGCIDDQVHFREPGLTHKGDLFTESRAAVAGGVTTFMEMPNTIPNALTQELLEDKYRLAAEKSIANYSFFMGVSNNNRDEVLKTNPETVCGIKIFMGSSTGNMLVDDSNVLHDLFANAPTLISTHCEDEKTIRHNLAAFTTQYGDGLLPEHHPLIRSAEACYLSSSFAVELAKKYGTRLHILHISTARETELFSNDKPLKDKKITAEACIHHLWFSDSDYKQLGNRIKWNPAVKTAADRKGIWEAVLDNRIDVIATDHAPHTLSEKSQSYAKAPAGGPMVQHSLIAMLEKSREGMLPLERVAEKMAHAVATCFRLRERGFVREGYYADLVLVDMNKPYTVTEDNLLYKCGWSPMEGVTFGSSVTHTFVNGNLVYKNGKIIESGPGMRLSFDPLH